jgi:hypothetical protein
MSSATSLIEWFVPVSIKGEQPVIVPMLGVCSTLDAKRPNLPTLPPLISLPAKGGGFFIARG